jgi:putative ubiquitin-RnfH superfamily antitoxin RatB of RatAB toxin-antitoxin module
MPMVHYVKDGDKVELYRDDGTAPKEAEPTIVPDRVWRQFFR